MDRVRQREGGCVKRYTRPRPFVALTVDGRRETLTASSKQPTKAYIIAMFGPFKTFRAARFFRSNPAIFARSINQIEQLAKETA